MSSPSLDIPEPEINPESEPYWLAANDEVLLLGKCGRCGEFHHYPRRMCPLCNSTDVSWVPAGGSGAIYSFSTLWRTETPYTLAWIVLDERVGMMTNIVDCDPRGLAVGQRVKIVFAEISSGQKVPMAAPQPGQPAAAVGDRQ
jgi:uncharacterized protein